MRSGQATLRLVQSGQRKVTGLAGDFEHEAVRETECRLRAEMRECRGCLFLVVLRQQSHQHIGVNGQHRDADGAGGWTA